MHIGLREGDGEAVGLQHDFGLFGCFKVNIPVVGNVAPGPYGQVDGAVREFGNGNQGLRGAEDFGVVFHHFKQHLFGFRHIGFVGNARWSDRPLIALRRNN